MAQQSRDALRRRRKRVLLLVLVALVLLVSPLFALSMGSPAGSPAPARVVVGPGDTLWDLAKEYGPPNADLRQVVREMRETNGLDGSLIRPGQVLLIETE
ncbi:MAG: LysM peptidoglycan-binding domain-containing protein [Armatimonadetes bacterium]|nr:LysM peptidoglycan-binding domain-containing protein [Armatimonadota bacterium]